MATRRRFVKTAAGAVLVSDLVILGQGCSGPEVHDIGDGDDDDAASPVPTVTPNGNLVSFPLTDYPTLANVDGTAWAYVEGTGTILVARQSDSAFIAVNQQCTHVGYGCSVQWQGSTDRFRCGCHGATYNADGTIVSGPVSQPLKTYPVSFDGSVVVVDITPT